MPNFRRLQTRPAWRRAALVFVGLLLVLASGNGLAAAAEVCRLQPLIDEALRHSPDLGAAQARLAALENRIPQAGALADPMLMAGYQNMGFRDYYNFGENPDAQWMFSASQQFLFPGKRALKSEAAALEAQSGKAGLTAFRCQTVGRVKELYFDLFLAHREIALIEARLALLTRVEEAAAARYAAGTAMQQEMLMAQTEKYMFLEKREMADQRVQALEAMLNSVVGRAVDTPVGVPEEPRPAPLPASLAELLPAVLAASPEIITRQAMVAGAESREQLARRAYYPDMAVSANYYNRGGDFEDMWSLTTTFNVPIFFAEKQKPAVAEAGAELTAARHELEAARLMVAARARDAYAMATIAERLMTLYRDGLSTKTEQDTAAAVAAYTAGGGELRPLLARITSLIDYELLYWRQFVEREKAAARLAVLAGEQQAPASENQP